MEHVRSQKLFPIYSFLAPHAVRQLRCLANFRPILSLDDDSFVHSSSASAVSFPSPFIFLFFKYYTFSLLYFQIYLVLVKSWTHIPIVPVFHQQKEVHANQTHVQTAVRALKHKVASSVCVK